MTNKAVLKNALGELERSVTVKFGSIKRVLDTVVFDEHGNIIAAFPNEASAKQYQKLRGFRWDETTKKWV